jgi:hypothetical protein
MAKYFSALWQFFVRHFGVLQQIRTVPHLLLQTTLCIYIDIMQSTLYTIVIKEVLPYVATFDRNS